GAWLFAFTRTAAHGRVPQEAIIGIVYVVATAATLLLADKAPQGAEAIKEILVGSIIWVTWATIGKLILAYSVLGAFHYVLRHKFLTISFQPDEAVRQRWNIRWWDFWFYLSFGIVIIFSVPVGGVLMVFTFLVVPAAIAFLFTRELRRLTYIAWGSGALASALGLWFSFRFDLPTGPLIVCMYGIVLAAAAALKRFGVGREAAR
ncbi:MAG TPA: metal ABC transporter permease, partial [Gemmatimonadales bacterium]